MQAKLLRFLEEREIHPLGAPRPRKIDVRVVSASNRDLPREVEAGRFRADPFYGLRGLLLHIPPLRERRADIPVLTKAFAERAALEHGRIVRGISRGALELVSRRSWPGNVRELASEVERAVLLVPDGAVLESEHLAPVRWVVERMVPSPVSSVGVMPSAARKILEEIDAGGSSRDVRIPKPTLQEKIDAVERVLVEQALAETGGNKTQAAALLGVTRSGLGEPTGVAVRPSRFP